MNSAAIFRSTSRAVVHKDGSLELADMRGSLPLVPTPGSIQFLCASSDGLHFAFYSNSDNRFHLFDTSGNELWSRGINSDKGEPTGVLFSACGDGAGFSWDYDGLARFHFVNVRKRYSTIFAGVYTVGFDIDLRRFVENNNSHRAGEISIHIRTLGDGVAPATHRLFRIDEALNVAEESVVEKRRDLVILDRHRQVREYVSLPFDDWTLVSVERATNELVVLRRRDLLWFPASGTKPLSLISDCLDQPWHAFESATVTAIGDLALLFSPKRARAVLASKTLGVVRRGSNVLRATLEKDRAVFYLFDHIEVANVDGSVDTVRTSIEGENVLAADLSGSKLSLCLENEGAGRVRVVSSSVGFPI
jgi:hypothetical protein